MLRLAPMNDAEFEAFLARAIPRRAERMVSRGLWEAADAEAAAREIYRRTLPNGVRTDQQHFCHLVDEPSGRRVGEAWYQVYVEGGRTHFYLSWIWVEPEFRRRGFATEALHLLEAEAARQGAVRTFLDVWVDNPEATRLYEKLGYRPSRVAMVKPLVDEAAGPTG